MFMIKIFYENIDFLSKCVYKELQYYKLVLNILHMTNFVPASIQSLKLHTQ